MPYSKYRLYLLQALFRSGTMRRILCCDWFIRHWYILSSPITITILRAECGQQWAVWPPVGCARDHRRLESADTLRPGRGRDQQRGARRLPPPPHSGHRTTLPSWLVSPNFYIDIYTLIWYSQYLISNLNLDDVRQWCINFKNSTLGHRTPSWHHPQHLPLGLLGWDVLGSVG